MPESTYGTPTFNTYVSIPTDLGCGQGDAVACAAPSVDGGFLVDLRRADGTGVFVDTAFLSKRSANADTK